MRCLIPPPAASEARPAADQGAGEDAPPAADAASAIDLAVAYRYPADRPWLRANMVASVDGATTLDGRSGGLSGGPDRQLFHVLRSIADVILVGASTVRVEGYGPAEPAPGFATLRIDLDQPPAPVMAVVSASLDLDPASALFTEAIVPTIVLTCEDSPAERRAALAEAAEVLVVGKERVDVAAAVDALVERGHRRLLCEGGPHLLGQLVAADRLDELCLTLSPLFVGDPVPGLLAGGLRAKDARPLRLGQLLEQDGVLFARYLVGEAASATAYPGS